VLHNRLNDRRATYMVPMVHKVVKVLEAFRANRNRLSFLEITQSCGLAKASAFRILESLQCLGYVCRDRSLSANLPLARCRDGCPGT